MTKARKVFVAAIGLVSIAAVVTTAYLYRSEQQRQSSEATVLLEKGIAQFREEQYEQALQTLGSIPAGTIKDWRAPYYMGSALIQLKDYESAAVQLEEALSLSKHEKNVLFALGVVYYKLGNISLSKGYFAAVIEIDPGHEEAKGLMDIMANLERYSAEGAGETDR